MANITIRDLPDQTKEILRVQAAKTGISLEAYARYILQTVSTSERLIQPSVLELAGKYFGTKHGVDISLPERSSKRGLVDFD